MTKKQNSNYFLSRTLCILLALLSVGSLLFLPDMAVEVYAADKKVTIPSPAEYFGDIDKTDRANKSTVYYCEGHNTYPKSQMEAYVKALNKAGLTGAISKESNGDMLASLKYNGEWGMAVRWYKNDKYVWVNVSDCISVAAPTSPETVVTPTKPNSSDPSILDIIEDCFGTGGKKTYNKDNYETVYTYSASSYPETKVNNFVKKMESLGAKCYITSFSSSGGSKTISVYMDVGSSIVEGRWANKTGTLKLTVDWEYIKKTGKFDEDDIPEEPAPTPPPGPNDKERCISCGGDGKCSSCGGSGTIRKWVSGTVRDYVNQNCTSCYSPGKCRDCGGDGWK